jgi:PAS domain S-box-containing protein
LAERRFETGFDIHTPIGAAGRFRRGMRAVLRLEGDAANQSVEATIEDQVDAFNRHFSAAFAALLLRASEMRLRELFDNASDVFMRFDAEGVLSDANLSFERVLGHERSRWIGRSWLELVHPSQMTQVRRALESIHQGTVVTGLGLQLRSANGEFRRLVLSGHRSDSDPRGHMIAILRDTTREQTLRAQVVQAEKLASIGQLAASVAHELNNPLTWISSNLTDAMQQEGANRNPLRSMLQDSLLGAERMATIVSDLRTYSRIDEHLTEFNLTEVIDLAIRITGNQLSHRARVERRYGPMPPFIGHAGRLSQVFVNLFVNSAQALGHRRSEENRVRITTDYDDQGFRVEISDNGPGIPPDVLASVFQPFVSTKGPHGTGLGLWVCKNIVEEHGGTIELDSDQKGTRFNLRLPHRHTRPSTPPAPSQAPPAVAAGLVLVVDDEEILLRVMSRRIGKRHKTITARSGPEALTALEAVAGEVDAIVCDLGMPGMGGVELYQLVKKRWPRTADRFRFMSGAPEWYGEGHPRRLEQRCYRKPLEIPDLLEAVDQLVADARNRNARGC